MLSPRAPASALLALAFALGCSSPALPEAGLGEEGGAGPDAAASGSEAGEAESSSGDGSGGGRGRGSGGGSSGGGSGRGSSSSSGGGSGSSSGRGSSDGSDGSSGGTVDAGDPIAAARAQCVQIINQDRATLGVAPLSEDFAEESCVDSQAEADYVANSAHSAFGKCGEWAQDECPGWQGPPSAIDTGCLAEMWAEGPPPQGQDNHWLNMSNASYARVACGFYQTPAGDWWATQDFW